MNVNDLPAALPSRLTLTLEAARRVLDAAEGLTMCVAILDDGGHLVAFARIDGTQIGSVGVSQAKALSAVSFRRPTKVFEDRVAGGGHQILGLSGAVPVEGGVPLIVDGQVVGAIGVSGGTPAQDGRVALAGTLALGPPV